MTNFRIAIDAGHGSNTAGKRTPPFTKDVDIDGNMKIDIKKGAQYNEHLANVGVANLLYNKLVQRGYEAVKVGWDNANAKDDPDITIYNRQHLVKVKKCDISVSIHFNAYGSGTSFNSARGVGVYIHNKYPGDSKKLAETVLKELVKGTPQLNRGIHREALGMCNCRSLATKASIICELAFMTNQSEAMNLMANRTFWNECAQEIADAIDAYFN